MFPLPLTPFERYYWHDDRPTHPTSYAFELTFRGELEREALEHALAIVFRRHVLLGARIEDGPRGPAWISGSDCPPPIDWADATVPICHSEGPRINLATNSGLRVWVRSSEATTLLRLQIHHLCADGLAALRVIEELLVAYDRFHAAPGTDVALPPLEPEKLRDRGRLDDAATAAAKSWHDHVRHAIGTIAQWSGHALRPAVPLSVPAEAIIEPDDAPALGFTTIAVKTEELQRSRESAQAAGATWNDLLLAELMQLVRVWNREHGARPGTVRLNMPVSLRSTWDQTLPACNRISFAFVFATARMPDEALLVFVKEQTKRIKEERLAHYFIGGLDAALRVPHLVPWFLNRQACFATACLSNVGRLFLRTPLTKNELGQVIAGGATLVRIGAAPPVRPLTRVAIAVMQYGPEVTFNVRVDPTCLSRQDAVRIGEQYVARLRFGDNAALDRPQASALNPFQVV